MTDETINRILDMIENAGAIVLPVVVLFLLFAVVSFVVALRIIIKVAKEAFKEEE